MWLDSMKSLYRDLIMGVATILRRTLVHHILISRCSSLYCGRVSAPFIMVIVVTDILLRYFHMTVGITFRLGHLG